MIYKGAFEIGQQLIDYVMDDAILLCCEASIPVGGFVAAQFIIKDSTQRATEIVNAYWGLATFAGGRFVLQPHTICPWCKRTLPNIHITPIRSAIN